MNTQGNKAADARIQAIKTATPQSARWILDRAIQRHGASGLSQNFPLAEDLALTCTLRLADGPHETHLTALGRDELKRRAPHGGRL